VHKVSPHGRLPVPNKEDYNLDPNTLEGEFYQEEGLEGTFVIELTEAIDVGSVVEEDDNIEDEDVRDLQLLERLRLDNDNDDNIAPSDSDEYMDMANSDDERDDPPNVDQDDYF
jgi:hypothetical protein